ncbi:hypothetical protein AXK57_20755 [Tsukamurella pulmonis]|uniref:hypothetical protein n=1 Tax=Tsukamurella pulmonis TaxID=47312 RepID=UPI0007984B5E|nr:hypothetical protein [Tsukamurella pulmonis]KXP11993.1 hypothetical protein AXK57_20755 [Tsukamurella pulmonis]
MHSQNTAPGNVIELPLTTQERLDATAARADRTNRAALAVAARMSSLYGQVLTLHASVLAPGDAWTDEQHDAVNDIAATIAALADELRAAAVKA